MNCSPERLNKFTKFILQQRQPVTVLFFPHRDHSGCYQGFGPNDTFKWHLIVDLIYDSLILSVCEHLLMRLRDSSISMNDPFISLAHFNIGPVCVFFFPIKLQVLHMWGKLVFFLWHTLQIFPSISIFICLCQPILYFSVINFLNLFSYR